MKRVLIVEDDPTWILLLEQYAGRLGWESVVAHSPQLAMDALDDQLVDVIVLDMLLAVETGMALLNELRGYDDLAAIPVVVFTGMSDLTLEVLSSYGVRAVLEKATATPEDVVQALREVTNG